MLGIVRDVIRENKLNALEQLQLKTREDCSNFKVHGKVDEDLSLKKDSRSSISSLGYYLKGDLFTLSTDYFHRLFDYKVGCFVCSLSLVFMVFATTAGF